MSNIEKYKYIVSCTPCYPNVHIDDIILIQNILAKDVNFINDVKSVLSDMVLNGYLVYDQGCENKVEGWHLTQKAIDELVD